MKQLTLILLVSFFIHPVFSQDCEVSTPSIQGKYTGGCKNKKADGMGKAEGTDSYEGNFKNGYPSGEGTYTYKNGDFYTGTFKKGLKDGKGEMHYKTVPGDSTITGYWSKDIYVGIYLHPYELQSKSGGFTRLDVREDAGMPNSVTIESENIIKSNSLFGGPPPLPVIRYVTVSEGSYEREERSQKDKTSKLILYGVKFPFHIQVDYEGQSFNLLISQKGTWNILAQISMSSQ